MRKDNYQPSGAAAAAAAAAEEAEGGTIRNSHAIDKSSGPDDTKIGLQMETVGKQQKKRGTLEKYDEYMCVCKRKMCGG